jgi:putative oxidoreductase
MIERVLNPRVDAAYAVLRVITGLLFSFHGVQAVFGVLIPHQPPVGSQLWIGGVVELGCGLAIAAGLLTRWAAFVASGTMAVAYIQYHWRLALGAKLLPAVNQGELAVVYCFLFLYIACRGPGRFSLDAWSRRLRTADR